MFGESPLAIPLSLERTKYPAIQDRMKSLIQNREEALAAHELARSRMADQQKSMFVPFTKGDQVWLDYTTYKENGIYGENFVKPPSELEEGEEVYDMETILNHRKRG